MLKKIILPGLLAGIIMLIVGMAVGQLFMFMAPGLNHEYENVSLFRPWSDPLMWLYFVHPFALGLVLSLIWNKVKTVFHGVHPWSNGLQFGFAYWLISVAGMLISYATFPVSIIMVTSWTAGILIEALVVGILFSKMNA